MLPLRLQRRINPLCLYLLCFFNQYLLYVVSPTYLIKSTNIVQLALLSSLSNCRCLFIKIFYILVFKLGTRQPSIFHLFVVVNTCKQCSYSQILAGSLNSCIYLFSTRFQLLKQSHFSWLPALHKLLRYLILIVYYLLFQCCLADVISYKGSYKTILDSIYFSYTRCQLLLVQHINIILGICLFSPFFSNCLRSLPTRK